MLSACWSVLYLGTFSRCALIRIGLIRYDTIEEFITWTEKLSVISLI